MRASSTDDSSDSPPPDLVCSLCGNLVPDWTQVCERCGRRVRTKESAARSEIGHIEYLLKQIPWLQRRAILPDDTASRLRNEYESRTAALNRLLSPPSTRPAAPTVPPLITPDAAAIADRSPTISPAILRSGDFDLPLSAPAGIPSHEAVPSPTSSAPEVADDEIRLHRNHARRAASPEELRQFFQAHGLKLIFALATMLVGYALRNIIAWQTVGDIAIRTVPAILIGLTFMFAVFGARTRTENSWAAFVFHAMACVLAGFDVGPINRFWMAPLHLEIPAKAALVVGCAVATGMAFMLLARIRQPAYLHLVQSGILLSVFSILQLLRLVAWHERDFRAEPLALFCVSFLVVAAINFAQASRSIGQTSALPAPTEMSESSGSGGEPVSTASSARITSPEEWRVTWTLWANLAAGATVIASSLNVLLSDRLHPHDFTAVLLMTGIVYGAGAQALRQSRAAYTAGALFGGSALLWLSDSYAVVWPQFSFLVMAISAMAMALAVFSGRTASAPDDPLVMAWRRVARYSLLLAAILVSIQVTVPWTNHSTNVIPAADSIAHAVQSVVSGLLLLLLGHIEARAETTYGAAAMWAVALIGLLEAARAGVGAYAAAFVVYGAVLYVIAIGLRRRSRTATAGLFMTGTEPRGYVDSSETGAGARPDDVTSETGTEARGYVPGSELSMNSAGTAPGSSPATLDEASITPGMDGRLSWLSPRALARSGQMAAACGALGAAALPTVGLPAHWLWATAAMAIGCALYVITALEERSQTAVYAALTCVAYASALLLWRVDHRLSLADLLAPFAVGSGTASLLLRSSNVAAAATHPIPHTDLWRLPAAIGSMIAVAVGILSIFPALVSAVPIPHPDVSALPLIAASVLVAAGRRNPGADPLRWFAVLLANVSSALAIALLSGLAGGPERWRLAAVETSAAGWLMQSWLLWMFGSLLSRRPGIGLWSPALTNNSLILGVAAAAVCTLAAASVHSPYHVMPISLIMIGSFALMLADTWTAEGAAAGAGPRRLSVVVFALSAAAHAAMMHACSELPATAWTLFALFAASAYYLLERKDKSENAAHLMLIALVVGFGLFTIWKAEEGGRNAESMANAMLDVRIANFLWLGGAIGAGLIYHDLAARQGKPVYATIAAVTFVVAGSHAVLVLSRTAPSIEWLSLLLLPWLYAIYGVGAWRARSEPIIGDPYRFVALGAAACAACLVTARSVAHIAPVTSNLLPLTFTIVASTFILAAAESIRASARLPAALTMALVAMAGVCIDRNLTHGSAYPATIWVLFAIGASGVYFEIARRSEQPAFGSLALWPLSFGYLLFAHWKAGQILTPLDIAVSNGFIVLGGLAATSAYFVMAYRTRERAFAYLAAIMALATAWHTLTLVGQFDPEWFALALLPAMIIEYLAGIRLSKTHEALGVPLREVGAAAVSIAALFVTARAVSGFSLAGHIPLIPGSMVTFGAFALNVAEITRRRIAPQRTVSFVALVLTGLVFHAYSKAGPAWLATTWTVAMLAGSAGYFWIARGERDQAHDYTALAPLLLGYMLYQAWRTSGLLMPYDNHVADTLWVAGVTGAAIAYMTVAMRRKTTSFAYLAALLLIASYTHGLSILDPHERHVDRYALLVLPLLAGMYAYGVYRQADEFSGRPFRRVSLALSALAVLCSILYGDGYVAGAGQSIDHPLITWTIAAYGAAYAAIALYRRTPVTLAAASITLTAAYLHGLIAQTAYWSAEATLSWQRFSALVVVAGIVWSVIGWLIVRRFQAPEHARPLQVIAALLAVVAAMWAVGSGPSGPDGDWRLAALAGGGAVWITLWAQECVEVCWHIGAWNLLAAWGLAIGLHLGGAADRMDLYIVPAGAYLLIAGHRSAERDQIQAARAAWWAGLVVMLGSCFILYWTRAAGGHHNLLLISECVVATLWGVIRRIRAYVSAGFGFLVLLTVASWFRHVNDIAGTISALAIGVALFVYVYYWLTHRERIENWLLRASGAWRSWQAWR